MIHAAVIDAQGGGLGAAIVKKMTEQLGEKVHITALGTNAVATTAMKKSGARVCATGENAVRIGVRDVDVIVGGVGIIAPSGMLGEITPVMAQAISESRAVKILIPISRCSIMIAGTDGLTAGDLIDNAVKRIGEMV